MRGSHRRTATNKAWEFTGAVEACAADFIALLRWLPRGLELGFYDQYYLSMSDPGAYAEIQRNDSMYVYMLGNHGWSSDWAKQSPELWQLGWCSTRLRSIRLASISANFLCARHTLTPGRRVHTRACLKRWSSSPRHPRFT